MSSLPRFASWGISIDGSVAAGLTEAPSLSTSLAKALLSSSGDLTPSVGATLSNSPKLSFKTRDLSLLEAPVKIASGVVLCGRAYDDASGLATAHLSYTIAKGLLVPVSISAQANQPAELSVELYPVSSDGDSLPIAVGNSSIALVAHGDVYVLGDFSIASSKFDGVQSLNLDFGFSVKTNAGENGAPFPTLAYYDAQQAALSATVAGLSGVKASHLNVGEVAAVSATFRKLAEGGVPSGGVRVSFAKALIECGAIQGGRPMTAQLLASAVKSGTSAYLAFSSIT